MEHYSEYVRGILHSRPKDRRQIRRLRCLHRGVYAVGHRALSNEGHWMAAVLACGEGAVLSTIQDLGRTESPEIVRRAIRQAEFLGLPLKNISTDRTRSELDSFTLPAALASAPGSVATGWESVGVGGPPNGL